MKKFIYILISLVIVIGLAIVVILNLPQSSSQNKKTDLSIDSHSLFEEFNTDEAKANIKYSNKTIEVQGIVKAITKDQQGSDVIILDGGNDFAGVLCTLEKPLNTELKPGDKLKIKGQCNGILMDVILNKCLIINE